MEGFIQNLAIEDDKAVLYFSGCNFSCPWCNKPGLLEPKEEFKVDLRDIKKQICDTDKDKILFTGGEPCLQRAALLELARFSKDIGKKTALHTNGSKPECIRLLLPYLDAIALDIKAPFSEQIFQRATRSRTFFIGTQTIMNDILQTLMILKRASRLEIEIVTLIIPGQIFRKEDILRIAQEIDMIDCTWHLQGFMPDNVSSRFSDISPPGKAFLEDLKDAVQKEFCHIRIQVE